MKYEVLQTRRFARQYKKLRDNVAASVDSAVETVAAKPSIGERKKGDLAQLVVYKFKAHAQTWLLGYSVDDAIRLVYLEAVSPHENFYRDLKQ